MLQHLSSFLCTIQTRLFPALQEELGALSDREEQFIRTCELIGIEKHLPCVDALTGRPRALRACIVRAFIAKSIYHFPTTKMLLDRLKRDTTLQSLCGWSGKWEIPSESTFSRAFAEFAQAQLPSMIHEAMIKTYCGPRLVGHISRDGTAIEAREKPHRKASVPITLPKRKRGRPGKGEEPRKKEPTKQELQLTRNLTDNLADIPTLCDWGTKRDSKGNSYSWVGYKLHIDTIDGDIPVSIILSSASMHDSQAAIPLAQMSVQRVINLYDLMDSAYDSKCIKEMSVRLNHVPLIDSNKRSGDKIEFDPAEQRRYNQRSSAERVNSNLKDNFGGTTVRVKGSGKVMAHLMFGIVALTAEAIWRLVS